jgi:hypothetical protein
MPADAVAPRVQDRERQHREREDREQMDRAPRTPHVSSWIQNELVATVTMSRTQIQPMVRWGSVPLGAASCTAPSPKAAKAAKACSWMAGAAFNSGASDTDSLTSRRACGIA